MAVSYLISSYNKAEYLVAVLHSVLRELENTGGEIFILDDGSSDESWQIIQEFARRDPRITIKRQENLGIFNVTTQLINFSRQKWLRIVDCDDPLIIGSSRLLVDIGEKTKVDYLFGAMIPFGPSAISEDRAKLKVVTPSSIEILSDPLNYAIREYNHIPAATLIRRDSIPRSIKLNESLISCQDLALALPIFLRGAVARINVPVCHQLTTSAKRLSANEALTYSQTIQIIKEFGVDHFDMGYKYIAARKIISRARRWMRKRRTISKSPVLYFRLSLLYGWLHFRNPVDWENHLDCAAEVYADFIPTDRRPY